jgi:5-methylcytosine-specific restriction endonuclease McrA
MSQPIPRLRKGFCERLKRLYVPGKKEYHQAYMRNYTQTPKWKAIAANNQSRRRSSQRDTDITTEFLLELWDKTDECAVCKRHLGLDRSLDHILPLIIGGKHYRDNVRYIHSRCNSGRPKDGSDIPSS